MKGFKTLVVATVLVGMTGFAVAQMGMGQGQGHGMGQGQGMGKGHGMGQGQGMGGMGQGRGQPGMGPVAEKCGDDLANFCPGIEHGAGASRGCLEKNITKVSAACKTALDSTGRGHRKP
jgi:hypothetical protein